MKFEFDPYKSEIYKKKHGIDFEEAKALWVDSGRIEIEARTIGEVRKLLIAKYKDSVWSAIFTIRADAIRIFSVRKSRKNEKEIYFNRRI